MSAAVVLHAVDVGLLAGMEGAVDIIHGGGDTRRVAIDDGVGRHVLGDNRACANEGVFADDDPGQDGHVDTDARAAFDGRAAGMGAFGAQGAHVVGNGDTGSQEGVVFDGGELGHVDVAVDLDVVADAAAVVNDRVTPDADVVADDGLFADDDVVAGLQAATDGRTDVDDGADFLSISLSFLPV